MKIHEYNEMMSYLTRPAMAHGGRIGFSKGDPVLTNEALEEFKRANSNMKHKDMAKILNKKYSFGEGLRNTGINENNLNKRITAIQQAYIKAGMPEEAKSLKSKFQYVKLTDKEILKQAKELNVKLTNPDGSKKTIDKLRDALVTRKNYLKQSEEYKQLRTEKTRENTARRIAEMTPEERSAFEEAERIKRRERRGILTKFYTDPKKAKDALWHDLVRRTNDAKGEGLLKIANPDEIDLTKKYLDKNETRRIVLVDDKGNTYKWDTLEADINKKSGYKYKNVAKAYEQRTFLNRNNLTQLINEKLIPGYDPNLPRFTRQNAFHIQHISGFKNNPWDTHITFGKSNVTEGRLRKLFDTEWEKASKITDKSKKFSEQRKIFKNYITKAQGLEGIAFKPGKKEYGTKLNFRDEVVKLLDGADSKVLAKIGGPLGCKVPMAEGGRIGLADGTGLKQCILSKYDADPPGTLNKVGRAVPETRTPIMNAFKTTLGTPLRWGGKAFSFAGKTLSPIATPFGAGALWGVTGFDKESAVDRATLGAEAAFAPELVKMSGKLTESIKNPTVRSLVRGTLNLGMPLKWAMRAARVLSPVGWATLGAEGVYQMY